MECTRYLALRLVVFETFCVAVFMAVEHQVGAACHSPETGAPPSFHVRTERMSVLGQLDHGLL